MSRARVKLCGITSLRDLNTAVEAGADAVGFVVEAPKSPRNLDLNKARKLVKATPVFVETVAVTILQETSKLEKIAEEMHPDIIQIHGSDHQYSDLHGGLPFTRLIGAIQPGPNLIHDVIEQVAEMFDAIIVDSALSDGYGGTGKVHNWDDSRRVRDILYPKPLILAGGLNPGNVKEAIQKVKPYAVDVSSGVESRPGIKDPRKIVEFIKNVNGAVIL